MLGTIGFMQEHCAGGLRQAVEQAAAADSRDAAAAELAGFDPTTASHAEKVLHTTYSKALHQGTNFVAMVYTFDQAAGPASATVGSAIANSGQIMQCAHDGTVGRIGHGVATRNVTEITAGSINSVALLIGVSNTVASVGGGLSFANSGRTFQVPQWIDDAAAAAFRNFRPTPATAGAIAADITDSIAIPIVTFAPNSAVAPITHAAMASQGAGEGAEQPQYGWGNRPYHPLDNRLPLYSPNRFEAALERANVYIILGMTFLTPVAIAGAAIAGTILVPPRPVDNDFDAIGPDKTDYPSPCRRGRRNR